MVEISTFSVISELLFTPTINMFTCYPLVIPTWYPLLGFTWNFFPGDARRGVFLRNWVTYRDHLTLDIFGDWNLWTSPDYYHMSAHAFEMTDRIRLKCWTCQSNMRIQCFPIQYKSSDNDFDNDFDIGQICYKDSE